MGLTSIEGRGAYGLVMFLARDTTVPVGRLGPCQVPAGYYLYIGSAMRGLGPRLRRHLRRAKLHHWHIDYFREIGVPLEVWLMPSETKLECRWAQSAEEMKGAAIPIKGFGASDCRCAAHLFHFRERPVADALRAVTLSLGEIRCLGLEE